jgi:hypothetical protein
VEPLDRAGLVAVAQGHYKGLLEQTEPLTLVVVLVV